jgi:hypothetical protein
MRPDPDVRQGSSPKVEFPGNDNACFMRWADGERKQMGTPLQGVIELVNACRQFNNSGFVALENAIKCLLQSAK